MNQTEQTIDNTDNQSVASNEFQDHQAIHDARGVEDDDDRPEWENVYNMTEPNHSAQPIWPLLPKKSQRTPEQEEIVKGLYYQTSGGGGEGGYVVVSGRYGKIVYRVHRGWHETFKVERLTGVLLKRWTSGNGWEVLYAALSALA